MPVGKTKLRFKGGDTLVQNLQIVARKYPQAATSALFEEVDIRLRGIVIPLTPLGDGGTLRGSFFVNRPIKTVRGPKVVAGFGGAASAYALAQHEGPVTFPPAPRSWEGKVKLDYSESGTGPKFLEKAVQELSVGHLTRLRKSIAIKIAKIKLKKPKRK